MENFRRLEVWQRAHAFAVEIQRHCRRLPWYEQTDLSSQMRRAATSVSFNIAEGCGRKVASRSNADLLHRLAIASGSLHELDSQIEYAGAVGYLAPNVVRELLSEVARIRRMLGSLIRRLRDTDRYPSR